MVLRDQPEAATSELMQHMRRSADIMQQTTGENECLVEASHTLIRGQARVVCQTEAESSLSWASGSQSELQLG